MPEMLPYCHTCSDYHTFSDADIKGQEYEGHDLDYIRYISLDGNIVVDFFNVQQIRQLEAGDYTQRNIYLKFKVSSIEEINNAGH